MRPQGLWPWLSVGVCTVLAALTMTVGVYGCYALAMKAEPEPPPPNRLNDDLRGQLAVTESQLCREREKVETEAKRHEATRAQLAAREQEVMRLSGLLDHLRRHAILFPERSSELRPEDMIPPQNLPVLPAAKE